MTFNVRVFGHAGIQRIPQVLQPQFSGNTTEQVSQPYLWAQLVTVGGAAAATAAVVNDKATMVIIEVPDGHAARIEFNSPQRPSPVIPGVNSETSPFQVIAGLAIVGQPYIDFGRDPIARIPPPVGATKTLTGFNIFSWMPGTTLSMVDATAFP